MKTISSVFIALIFFTIITITSYGEIIDVNPFDADGSVVAQSKNDAKDALSSESEEIVTDPPYYIETFEVQKKESIHIDSFYYVNHFFLHILTNFGILDRLNDEDVEYIIEETLRALSNKEPVNFIFNRYVGDKKLAISLSIVSKDDKNYLLLLTNYDSVKKEALPLDTPKEKRKDCFTTIYYIAPDKLINENHFYSREIEDTLKKAGNLMNLTDFYIFDEKTDNDSLIEEMLTKAYGSSKKAEDKFQIAVLFSLYYMMVRKTDFALTAIENARTILEKDMKENKKNLKLALDIQYQEIQLIRKLSGLGFK